MPRGQIRRREGPRAPILWSLLPEYPATIHFGTSLIYAGTPWEIEEYCRDLIAIAGKGGGYMFAMP